MEQLAGQYPGIKFIVIYTREPHPGEGEFRTISQPKIFEERISLAQRLQSETGMKRQILIDDMASTVQKTYGNLPNMLYLIDPEGKIFAKWDWADQKALEEKLLPLARP